MNRLEKLEKALKEYREILEKQMIGDMTSVPADTAASGSAVNTTMPMGVEKNDDEEDEGHEDEKEDKKMIEEKLDEHNEKKHGEPKDADTAMKTDELVKFGENGQWSIEKSEATNKYIKNIENAALNEKLRTGTPGKVTTYGKDSKVVQDANKKLKESK